MSKQHSEIKDIYRAMAQKKRIPLNRWKDNPSDLIGKKLDIIPCAGWGDYPLTETVKKVGTKTVTTENARYWISSGFQVVGGDAHAAVIDESEQPQQKEADADSIKTFKEPNPCRYDSHEWHEWEANHE